MDVRLPIYLDHHATTPCDPRVVEAMLPYFTEIFGNAASRSHVFGFRAKAAVEKAREQVAALIGGSPKEIVWTSGATEANNLAILGVADARRDERRHLVTVATEHKAVLDPCAHLASRGWEVTVLPVDSDGLVRLAAVEAALRPDTALVSVMLANNEIGTLQPVAEIAALCRPRGIVVHTDATQAAGQLPIDVAALGVDLLSLSAHKMYGPKGVGALWVRRGRPRVPIAPIAFGGGHERGLRSGTLAVQNLVGMGVAAELAREALHGDVVTRVRALRDRLWAGLQTTGGVHLAGSWAHRLPNNLNVGFEGVEAEALMMATKDVAVSSGSACTSATLEPSHVLRALGLPDALAHGSIRFGLGRGTTEAEIDHVIAQYARKVPELRAMNPLTSAPDVRTLDWIQSSRE